MLSEINTNLDDYFGVLNFGNFNLIGFDLKLTKHIIRSNLNDLHVFISDQKSRKLRKEQRK